MRTSKGPLPIVLAVTGHRDLVKEDEAQLQRRAAEIFRDLQKSYPLTPLRLLSGLAEGADRLVACVALEEKIELVACLPMERSLYESDFLTSESRGEFEKLLHRASDVISLPLVETNTSDSVRRPGPQRDLQYEALGKYLVRQCQILIALWDGEDTKLTGGTSSVVSLQRYGQCNGSDLDPHNPLDYPDTGPVYHITTRRKENQHPRGTPNTLQMLYHRGFDGEQDAQKNYDQTFRRTNAFNQDVVHKGGKLTEMRAQSKEWLMPEAIRRQFPLPLAAMIDRYADADSLALHYQRRTMRSLRTLIFMLGLGGLLLFELFAHGPESIKAGALFLYVTVILLAYAIYKVANFREIKTRHLDYRALAEGLRLQMFWRLAGLNEEVADHYLRKQKSEVDWIRNAIRVWSRTAPESQIVPNLPLVRAHWIQDQLAFFTKAAERNRRRNLGEQKWNWGLLCALLALAGGILAYAIKQWSLATGEFPHLPKGLSHEIWLGFDGHGLLVIAMTMLPALAGAIAAYSVKMAFGEQRKQYRRMKNLYQRGDECLVQAISSQNEMLARQVIFDLGKEALTENGDWVLLHRERIVEMFVGG